MSRTLPIRMSYPVALLTGTIGSFVLLSLVLIVTDFVRNDRDPIPQETNLHVEAFTYTLQERENEKATTLSKQIWTFEELFKIQTLYERQVALRGHLHTTSEGQINELLQESKSMDHDYGIVLLKCELFGRLTTIDPYQATAKACMYSWNIRSPYISAVFSEWSGTDIDAAISHAKTLSELDQGVAVGAILRSASNLTDTQVLEIARSFDKESLALDLIQDRNVAISSRDPESAWFAILNDDRDDYDQSISLSKIAKTWIDREGMGAFDRIEQSLVHLNTRREVLTRLAEQLAQSDPEIAFNHVKNWNDGPFNYSLRAVIHTWALREPSIALTAVATLDSERVIKKLQQYIISVWAGSDPRSLLENSEILPSESRQFGLERAIIGIASRAPEEAAQLLDSLNDNSAQTRVQQAIVANLIEQDVHKALDWVLESVEDRKKRHYLLTFIWPGLVELDAEFAMQIALQDPLEDLSGELGVEIDVIRNVAQTDIDQALSLLPQVRDGRTKIVAYSVVGSTLAYSGESDRAIELGFQLDESIQEDYFNSLVSDWAYKDPLGLFKSMDHIPGQNVKSTAAKRLEMANRFHKVFSNEQLDQIKKYQSADDRKRLESF